MKIKPNKKPAYKAPNIRPVPPVNEGDAETPVIPAAPLVPRNPRGEAAWLAPGVHDAPRGVNIAQVAKDKAQKAYAAQMAPAPVMPGEPSPDIIAEAAAPTPGAPLGQMPDRQTMIDMMSRRMAATRPPAQADPMARIYGMPSMQAPQAAPEDDYIMQIIRQRLMRGA